MQNGFYVAFSHSQKMVVHLGLLWVEIESTAVEVDGCFEVLAIAISSNSPFDRHDLAIDSLSHYIGDTVDAVADHIGQTLPDCLGHLLHRCQLGVDHSTVPLPEEFRC